MLDRNLEPARFHECESPWLRSFALDSVKCLVVCRGPVRMQAFEVLDEIGVREYGRAQGLGCTYRQAAGGREGKHGEWEPTTQHSKLPGPKA